MMFSPKLKAEWDQHVVHNGIKPSMEELRKYISARLLQTSATNTPVSTPSASAQVAAGSTSSPSPSSKSSKSRSPFKCVVCEECHGLLRCPTFIGYDVDKRNKTVRKKRLCINCFFALKLPRHPQHMSLGGSFSEGHSKFYVVAQLSSEDLSFTSKPIVFSVVQKMKPIKSPSNKNSILNLPSLKNLPLADRELCGPNDLYIGNMDMDNCVYKGSLKFDGLKVINTPFGWSVAGPLSCSENPLALMTTAVPDHLQDDLAKLWELDQVPDAPNLTPEANEVIQEFEKSHTRVHRRFAVIMPRPKNPPKLGESHGQAIKRLLANEKSLRAKENLDDFNVELREYITLGHAEKIPWSELKLKPHYYLPVHGVFKEMSTTTKTRPVFDASAKTTSGYSLNYMPGPNLYPPLPDVII